MYTHYKAYITVGVMFLLIFALYVSPKFDEEALKYVNTGLLLVNTLLLLIVIGSLWQKKETYLQKRGK